MLTTDSGKSLVGRPTDPPNDINDAGRGPH
jgi:hypothetical protein